MKPRSIPAIGALLALLAASALLLAACGSSNDESSTGSSSGENKPTIAVVSVAGSEYFATYNKGFEQAAEELGLDVDINNSPSLEASALTSTVNAAVATDPDYLIVSAIESSAMRQPLLAAADRGIKVITYDTQVEEPDFVTSFINANYAEYGELAAKALGGLTRSGKVQLVSVIPGNQQVEELEKAFSESLPSGVDELPVEYSLAENGKANEIVRATLTREPDLAGIAAVSAFGGEGAIAALREAGKTGEVKAVLMSANKFAISALRKDEVQAVIGEQLENIAATAVKTAVDDAGGKKVPETVSIPLCTITAETIDDPKNAPCIH